MRQRVVIVLFALAAAGGCSAPQTDAPRTEAPQAAATPETPPAVPPPGEAPLPDTASPYDNLPAAVRSVMDKPFTGDFDEMVKRRVIRVAVTFNRTHYFIDRGQERGLTYEMAKSFESDLNADLKTGNLKVNVVLLPLSRDQLHPAREAAVTPVGR